MSNRCLFAVAVLLALPALAAAQSPTKVLRFVPEYEATVLDPVTSVLQVTHQAALLNYDTLIGRDAQGNIQPQMLESFHRDPTGRIYTFVLRPKLTFQDGTPVRAADAVASLRRWAAKDNTGIWLVHFGMQATVVDERTFTVATPSPTPMLMEGLAQPLLPVFVMRERDAMTPADKQVADYIGSGPFRFVASEYVPGSQIVYERNRDYVPRPEPASGFAGGKVAKVDRVEFHIIPDAATAAAALGKGEVDIWEAPPLDLLDLLKQQPATTTAFLKTGGMMLTLRPNHLLPPFNNAKARQALLAMVDQDDFMAVASGGDASNMRACHAFLGCSTPARTEAGMEGFMRQDLGRGRELLKESGYDGRPIVLMQPTDLPLIHNEVAVAAQMLRQVGFNVDMQSMDWATLVQRRAKQDPTDKGGWNLFLTFTPDIVMQSPIGSPYLDSPCHGGGWFGWPCDAETNTLRNQWANEVDPDKSLAIYRQIQERSAQTVPFVPLGEYFTPIAYRKTVTGLVDAPLTLFWNVTKSD